MPRSTSFVLILATFVAISVSAAAYGATPLSKDVSIELLPDYKLEPQQGIDSVVGRLVKKGGPELGFEIGVYTPPDTPRIGGGYENRAAQIPEDQLAWRKMIKVGAREVHVAYDKNNRVTVSTAFGRWGMNLSGEAKTSEEVAEILLMAMTVKEAAKR